MLITLAARIQLTLTALRCMGTLRCTPYNVRKVGSLVVEVPVHFRDEPTTGLAPCRTSYMERTSMVKKIAIGVSATITLVVVAVAIWLASGGAESLPKPSIVPPMYDRRVSQFEESPVRAGDTVFLGDSITELGNWEDLFPDARVRNRGIVGDETAGVLARLDQLTAGKPGQVFLMIGTNDLAFGVDENEIVANVEEIVSRISSEAPGTEIFVQSVLPRADGYREQIESLNRKLRSATSGEATWIDLYPHFLDVDGSISDIYSVDELHLSGKGYLVWRDIIQRHVNEHPS